MKNLLLVITLIAANQGLGFAQQTTTSPTAKGVAVAFFDEERAGKPTLENFEYFFNLIRPIVKRDFPGIELRILGRGELLRLPDGTRLNVETIQPQLGFVLSAPGKKRMVLSGVQSDAEFACAAAMFFHQASTACPK